MNAKRKIIIVGAGHNGLVTAFYLAKAGFKPLVLKARSVVGGCATTEEIAPGFRCSTLTHSTGPLRDDVARDMQLERHGLKMVRSDLRVFAPAPDGRAISIYDDAEKSAQSIAKLSKKDAEKYKEFHRVLARMGPVLASLMSMTPPSIKSPKAADVIGVLKAGKGVRGLGKENMYRLLRWGPMAIDDLAAEWFETELLRATIAARGIFGTFLGPWSAGSSLVLLIRAAADPHPAGTAWFAAGGMGSVTQAMAVAAKQAGAEIRSGAEVIHVRIKEGAATGVVLSNGEEITAKAVISNADPKRTLLRLVDPSHLSPDFVLKLQHYRMPGTVAKVNLALSGLPKFSALNGNGEALKSRIHIGPEIDYLERAFDESKYGNFSKQPYLEVT